jgi:hypothetical protein
MAKTTKEIRAWVTHDNLITGTPAAVPSVAILVTVCVAKIILDSLLLAIPVPVRVIDGKLIVALRR